MIYTYIFSAKEQRRPFRVLQDKADCTSQKRPGCFRSSLVSNLILVRPRNTGRRGTERTRDKFALRLRQMTSCHLIKQKPRECRNGICLPQIFGSLDALVAKRRTMPLNMSNARNDRTSLILKRKNIWH